MIRLLTHPVSIIGLAILLLSTWAGLLVAGAGEHMAAPMLGVLGLCTSATIAWALPSRPAAMMARPGTSPQQRATYRWRSAGTAPASVQGWAGRRHQTACGGAHRRRRPGRSPVPPAAAPSRPGVSYAPGRATVAAGRRPLADTLIYIAHKDAAPAS